MATGHPRESEVRALVAGVVDGVLGSWRPEDGPGPEDPAPAPEDPASVGAVTRVAVGADHGGFRLKEFLVFRLRERGLEVADCGTHSTESVDYPEFALAVARRVAEGESDAGIVVDGAGIGSCITANKVPGVRAATCWDVSSARNSREHNHANVLALGAGLIGESLAWQIVEAWLDTSWAGGRHLRRVAEIMEIERRYGREG